jgi:coronin-1B/1C/6
MSDRQLALWDIKAAREPIGGFQMLDSISGVCMPFWDEGTQCLYLAGKGDGNIRYYEYVNDKFEYLSEYKSADPQRGVAFVPKRGVNMHDNEVMRAYKTVNDSYIEPISFIVPRRAETFQEDIYPPTVGLRPSMSSEEWFGGKTALPPKVDMETLYEGGGMKEVPSDAKPLTKAPEPEPAKEPEPVKQAPEPQKGEEEPLAAVSRAPPPSMKEQGGSMMAMADKFADKDGEREDSSDESSFEEVQKPIERAAVKAPPEDVKPAQVKNTTSDLWKAEEETGKGPGPSVLDEV